jgi:hypothetical protein
MAHSVQSRDQINTQPSEHTELFIAINDIVLIARYYKERFALWATRAAR